MDFSTVASLEFLAGGGETGALIRSKDWSQTPLGPPETWPQSLKTCVRIVLTSRQPMFVWWGNDLINLYNDAYRAIVGGKHPGALGQPASVVWHEIWDEVGPRAETALRHNVGTYDEALLLLMERNGYTEETYYTFSYSPVPGDHGRPEGIICANTDDTQRIVGERQLRTLTALGKNATASKTLVDAYEKTVRVLAENGADFPFLALYELENDGTVARLVGKSLVDLPENVTPASVDLTAPGGAGLLAGSVVDSGKIAVVEHVRARFGTLPSGPWAESPDCALLVPIAQSGQRLPFAVLVTGCNPYRQLDETYLSFFGLVADQIATSLTNVRAYEEERRRAEALREIDRAKTAFFSNVSHEFRTPLTLMLGPIEEALKADWQLPAPVQENLEIAHRNALRLQKLVNTLLDFSRIEAGRMRASYEPTDLAALTTDLASTFRSAIERVGMRLVVTCLPLPEAVYVDREMWEKVVLNLLSNAFKYTLEGQIVLSLTTEDGQAVLRVQDTGVGIPEAELPRLFERFHRVAGSQGRTFEGTGIGLSLIRELVGLHGGSIRAESTPGQGSTFTVRIPLGNAHLPAEFVVDQPPRPITAPYADPFRTEALGLLPVSLTEQQAIFAEKTDFGGKAHIVLADDNADMRAYVQRLLEPHYRVSVAADGQEARRLVAQHRPDLVLSDVMMPVMDGLELLKTLKADAQTAPIPVVLLSARAGEEASIEGYEAGADDYLVKPFSANELLARVRAQLKIARIRSENERRLQNLFEQAPVGIAILRGSDYTFELVNDFYVKMAKRGQPSEIVGKPLLEAMPELEGQGFEQLLSNVVETGVPFVAKERPAQLLRDGQLETIYINFSYQPLPAPDSGVFVVVTDVTESVLARRRVEESESRFRQLADSMPQMVWSTLPDGYHDFYNQRWYDFTGLSYEQTKAEGWANVLHPDDYDRTWAVWQESLKTGKIYEIEYRMRRYDEAYVWQLGRALPVRDESGAILRWYGTCTDISDQKRAEAALRDSDRWFRQLADSMPQIVWTARPDGYLDYFNQRWYEFIDGDQGYGDAGWLPLLHPDDRQPCLAHWQHCLQTGEPYRFEFRLNDVRQPGNYRWYLALATAFQDADGTLLKWMGTCTDIHDQKTEAERLEALVQERTEALRQANADLQRSNLNLTQFAYVASHDLQEPLRKIRAFGDMLLKRNADSLDEAGSDRIRRMQQAASRMNDLIQDLLSYSRVSTRQDTFQPVDLTDLLASVRSDLEVAIREQAATLSADPLPVVRGDATQLRQMLQNLISNSLKFSRQGVPPAVAVRYRTVLGAHVTGPNLPLQPDAHYHEISVIDNGIGFDEQFSDRIFEAFQRLHGRAEYSGTGIGLAIVKKVVENHHGGVAVSSRESEGTTFRVYLPVGGE